MIAFGAPLGILAPDRIMRKFIAIPAAILALGALATPGLSAEPGAGPVSTADADFRARCSAPGVVKCTGFDTPADFADGLVSPSGDNRVFPEPDRQVYASGGGALRFTIPARSPANSSGYWADSLGRKFGPGDKLHLQFRQRFSKSMLNTEFEPKAGWKQFILYPASHPSCTTLQFVMINGYLRGFPTMYASCGSMGLETELPDGDIRIQQGEVDCRYRDMSGCMRYAPDEWMTFYFEFDLGEFGSPSTRIRAWMGYQGKPLRQIIDQKNFSLDYDSSASERLNRIQLTPYHTDKNYEQVHPIAYTWYDELIVATTPIAAPR